MSTSASPYEFVCLAVGSMEGRAETYIERLYAMLRRHVRTPFRLHCYTDVARNLPAEILQHDCSSWRRFLKPGERLTRFKLSLFNPDLVPLDEFFYLDLSIVVQKPLDDWLRRSLARPEDLLIVRDWNYDSYNSSVMRIRSATLRVIHDDFTQGVRYPYHVAGDQDYVRGCIAAHGLEHRVGTFEPADIVSYKTLRRLGRRQPDQARQAFDRALIVKFHGQPKQHVALSGRYHFLKVILPQWLTFRRASYIPWERLRREWTDAV